jgi:hypothetical protein
MMLGFLGGQSLLVIVSQKLVQEVDGFIGDVALVVCKRGPREVSFGAEMAMRNEEQPAYLR